MDLIIQPEEVGILARPISQHIDREQIASYITEVEQLQVRSNLGSVLYTEIKQSSSAFDIILNGGIDEVGEVSGGLRKAVAYYVYARIIREGSTIATRFGAVEKTDEYSMRIEQERKNTIARECTNIADTYMAEVIRYAKACGWLTTEGTNATRRMAYVVGDGAQAKAVASGVATVKTEADIVQGEGIIINGNIVSVDFSSVASMGIVTDVEAKSDEAKRVATEAQEIAERALSGSSDNTEAIVEALTKANNAEKKATATSTALTVEVNERKAEDANIAKNIGELETNIAKNASDITANTEELAKQAEELENKAPKVGYAPDLKVDFAKELVGRGVAEPQAIGTIRPTGEISIGDGNATIEKVKGKSVVYNQHCNYSKIIQLTYGLTFEAVGDKIRMYGTSTRTLSPASFRITRDTRIRTQGHKYLVYDSVSNISCKLEEDIFSVIIHPYIVEGEYYDKILGVSIHDLTQMFGEGNEPTTIEEFEARKPLNVSNDYNEGEIISYDANELKSVGFNAWDEIIESGEIDNNGLDKANSSAIRSKNFIRIFPKAKYRFEYPNSTSHYIALKFYDENKNFLKSGTMGGANGVELTTSANICYIRFYMTKSQYSSLCIHLVHTGYRNGEYQPYENDILKLPDVKGIKDADGNQLFPYGLLSAGSVYDEITATKAVKRVEQRAFSEGDNENTSVLTDGTNTIYALAEPIEVDLPEPLNLTYDAWDFGTEELIADGATTPLNADIVYQFNAVDRIRENTTNVSEIEEKVATKQDELTLTVLDNGNIRIGNLQGQTKDFMPATPSGDPMHYAYEAIGAEYNATVSDKTKTGVYGDTITHKAGHWYLNEIGDLSAQEIAEIYRERWPSKNVSVTQYFWKSNSRTVWIDLASDSSLTNYLFYYSPNIEKLKLAKGNTSSIRISGNPMASIIGLSSLTKILTVLNVNNATSLTAWFDGCPALEEVRISGLKCNISFKACSNISKASVKYMIEKAVPTSAITITLHADAYARLAEDADIVAALEAKPLVTLVSA